MTNDAESFPLAEFAFPGPLRDELVAAILAGSKTATSGLLEEYEREGETLPERGDLSLVVDSERAAVAVIETTEVSVLRVGDVDLAFVVDEGEGFASVSEWRAAHEEFWHGSEFREALGEPAIEVTDDTLMVAERFRVVERM